jgi:hypothetical protein
MTTKGKIQKQLPSLPPSPTTLKDLVEQDEKNSSAPLSTLKNMISNVSSKIKKELLEPSPLVEQHEKTSHNQSIKKLPQIPNYHISSEQHENLTVRNNFPTTGSKNKTLKSLPLTPNEENPESNKTLKKLPQTPNEHENLTIRSDFPVTGSKNKSLKSLPEPPASELQIKTLKKLPQAPNSNPSTPRNTLAEQDHKSPEDALQILWSKEAEMIRDRATSTSLVSCLRCKMAIYLEDLGDAFFVVKRNNKTNYLHRSCYKCFQCGSKFWNNSEIVVDQDRMMYCKNCADPEDFNPISRQDDDLDP